MGRPRIPRNKPMGVAKLSRLKYGDDYFAVIGQVGGKAKVPKGVSVLSPEERRIRASEAANARWKKVRENA